MSLALCGVRGGLVGILITPPPGAGQEGGGELPFALRNAWARTHEGRGDVPLKAAQAGGDVRRGAHGTSAGFSTVGHTALRWDRAPPLSPLSSPWAPVG